ncbi:MAG: RsmE family RNA methyltransferase [bacterium]
MSSRIEHRRFWIKIDNGKAILHNDEFRHIRVQRLKLGDEFIGIDGSGLEFLCRIDEIKRSHIGATIISERYCAREPGIEIILCQAELKGLGLSTAIDLLIQAGITRYIYFQTDRSQGRNISMVRIKRKMMSSIKQSGRARIISIIRYSNIPSMFEEMNADEKSLRLLLSFDDDSSPIYNVLPEYRLTPSNVVIVVGPEGDFTGDEMNLFLENGFIKTRLGDIRIRSYLVGAFAVNLVLNYFEKDKRRRQEEWRIVSSVR